MNIQTSLDYLIEHYQKTHQILTAGYDAEWRSPCEIGLPFSNVNGEKVIQWAPVKKPPGAVNEDQFAGIQNALETSLHADIKTFYSSYWSGNLETQAPDGHVSLIQLWNAEDADRLIENLIGHALDRKRCKADLSLFFACTEPDSELILSVHNDSGAVLLERPGAKPLRQVADSLAEFIDRLVPAPKL